MFNLKTYFHWTYIRDIKIPKIQFTENFFYAFFRMLKLQSRISQGHWRTEILNRRTDKEVLADQKLSGSPGFRPDDLSTGVPISTSDVWKASRNDFHIRCIFFKNMFCSKAVEILCLCLMLNSCVFFWVDVRTFFCQLTEITQLKGLWRHFRSTSGFIECKKVLVLSSILTLMLVIWQIKAQPLTNSIGLGISKFRN